MKLEKRQYWSRTYWRGVALLVEVLGIFAFLSARLAFGHRKVGRICLVGMPPYRLEAVQEVADALALIRRIDCRRYRRVQKHISRIGLSNQKPLGEYNELFRICYVRKLPVIESSPFLTNCAYALVVVHEATHGLLASKGFRCTAQTKERIERICRREEDRFISRMPEIDARKLRRAMRLVRWKPTNYKEQLRSATQPNHTMQREGASRLDQPQFQRPRALAPTADGGRSAVAVGTASLRVLDRFES